MSDTDPTDASTAGAEPDAARDATPADADDVPADGPVEPLRVAPETDVPPGAPTHVCGRCGRPFPREEHLVLHRGLAHYDALTDAEREAFTEAYEGERAEIRRFRIVALGGLVLLYFGFLLAYATFA